MEPRSKQETLDVIRGIIASSSLTKEEVLQALNITSGPVDSFHNTPQVASFEQSRHFNFTKILYFLGGLLVLLGITTFVGMFWDTLGFLGQVIVTLGAGVIAYVVSILLRDYSSATMISKLSLFFSAILMPAGIVVILNEAKVSDWLVASWWVFAGFFILYLLSSFVIKYDIAHFLVVFSGSGIYFTTISILIRANKTILQIMPDLYAYSVIVISIVYLVLAQRLFPIGQNRRPLNTLLVFASVCGIFSAIHSLDGILWLVIFPFAIALFIYLSVQMNRRLILVLTSLFLISYVIRITGKYFVNTLSWPIALILGGVLIIGIGYASVMIGRKFNVGVQ